MNRNVMNTQFTPVHRYVQPLPVVMELELRGKQGEGERRRDPIERAEIAGLALQTDCAAVTFELHPLGVSTESVRGVLIIDLHSEYAPRLARVLQNNLRLPRHLVRRVGIAIWTYLSGNLQEADGDWVSCEHPDVRPWLEEHLTFAEAIIIGRFIANRSDPSIHPDHQRPYITVRN